MKTSLSLILFALACGSPIRASNEVTEAAAKVLAEDDVLRIYDISSLLEYSAERDELEHLFLPSANTDKLRAQEMTGWNPYNHDSFAHEFIERVLGDELYYEGRFVGTLEGQRLVVRGPAALQLRVQELLAFMDGFFNATTVLQVDLVRMDANAMPRLGSVMSPSEADALIARAGVRNEHQRFQLNLRADRKSSLRMVRDVPIVMDYSVEVAQGGQVWDAITAHIQVGTQLWARGVPSDNGLLLALSVMRTEAPSGVQVVPISCGGLLTLESEVRRMRGPESIQNMSIINRSLATNLFLPSGKVIALSSSINLKRGQRNELILIRQGAGQLPLMHSLSLNDQGAEMHIIDAQRFTPPQAVSNGELFDASVIRADMRMPWSGYEHPIMLGNWAFEPESSSGSDLLENFLHDSELVEVNRRLVLLHGNGAMTDASKNNHGREMVAGLLDGMPSVGEQVQISLRAWRKGQRQVVAEMVLPVRLGSSASGVLGIEDFEVESQYVEIASHSALSDPTTSSIFDGVALFVAPRRTPGGGIQVEVRGAIHLEGEKREALLGYFATESLMQTDHDALFMNESLQFAGLTSGETITIGETQDGLRLEVSLN